jgi:hypothetical protein
MESGAYYITCPRLIMEAAEIAYPDGNIHKQLGPLPVSYSEEMLDPEL